MGIVCFFITNVRRFFKSNGKILSEILLQVVLKSICHTHKETHTEVPNLHNLTNFHSSSS